MSPRSFLSFIIVFMLAVFPVAGIVSAHETTSEHAEEHQIESLLEQISELIAIVADLQAQLALLSGASPLQYAKLTRDLTIGDKGSDVKVLQQLLNSNLMTRVASSGAGSSGNETDYFGVLTAQAVVKFQQIHKEEILIPIGLYTGTGYVGPSTRKILNLLIDLKNIKASSESQSAIDDKETVVATDQENLDNEETLTTDGTNQFVYQERQSTNTFLDNLTEGSVAALLADSLNPASRLKFAVGSFSTYEASPGAVIEVEGRGFKNTAQFKFNGMIVNGTPNFDGSIFTFKVPSIPFGHYNVVVSQDGETSLRVIDFVVTYYDANTPEIYTISPAIGAIGSEITIYGKNFTKTNNTIDFGFEMGTFTGLSSTDGKSIIMTVNPKVNFQPSPNGIGEWPVYIRVINGNGISKEQGLFVLRM